MRNLKQALNHGLSFNRTSISNGNEKRQNKAKQKKETKINQYLSTNLCN